MSKTKRSLQIVITSLLIISVLTLLSPGRTFSQKEEPTFVVYFTGIGCPHCAKVDPVLLKEWVNKYPSLIVIEYEIYQQSQNAVLIDHYNSHYNSGYHIPLVVFNKEKNILGDKPILTTFESEFQNQNGNKLPLYDGSSGTFDDIVSCPLNPKIWTKDRIAIKTSQNSSSNKELVEFLNGADMEELIKHEGMAIIASQPVQLSGSEVTFDNAVKVNGWILQWNGPSVKGSYSDIDTQNKDTNSFSQLEQSGITLTKTISLAAVDAVNPCALAVLTMMLIAIISYNPNNKKNIILAGLAFTTSVFVMYMIYGLVIIRFFKIVQAITNIRLILYKVLGATAIILGILQIKDFLNYKPGSFGTEMPIAFRPKVKKIISNITSPKGAFGVGLFVTLFLLPCTIGPYVILGGMLSFADAIKSILYLILYNLIFISPMLFITGIVYLGVKKVEDVSEWKDKNIRILHLIAGIIIACLGIAMLLGLL